MRHRIFCCAVILAGWLAAPWARARAIEARVEIDPDGQLPTAGSQVPADDSKNRSELDPNG